MQPDDFFDIYTSPARVRETAEQMAEIVIFADAEGVIRYVSPAFTQVTGMPWEQLPGASLQQFLQQHLDGHGSPAWQPGPDSTRWAGRLQLRDPQGRVRWLETTISPIRFSDIQLLHYILVMRDTTQAARLQDELRQAQKMDAIGRLAGGLAHDFNNLLVTMLICCDLLDRSATLTEPDCENLEEIRRSCERGAALTRQLLTFSRRRIVQPTTLSLNDALRDMQKMLGRLVGEDIHFTTRLSAEQDAIEIDKGHLDQLVMNLVINARDAMACGGTLLVTTENVTLDQGYQERGLVAAPGAYVRLGITDTGCGMTGDTLERIFEPFFTTKEAGRGTGLGLPVVYGIVQQAGGVILIDSSPARGTTFHIYFPQATQEPLPVQSAQLEPAATGCETILLVEDDAIVRRLAVRILERQGYQVMQAASGEQALEICQRDHPALDLLLADVIMPVMNGFELADILSTIYPNLRVLFVSGYTDDTLATRGGLPEGAQLLQKPFMPSILLSRIREILDGQAST